MDNDREIRLILHQAVRITEAADDLQLQQRLRAFFQRMYERRLAQFGSRSQF